MTYRQKGKRDRNHPEIVLALRAIGIYVFETHGVGGGWPDIVAVAPGGNIFLIECKDPEQTVQNQQLTPSQVKFHADMARYGVTVHVVKSVDEALTLFGARAAA